MQTKSGTIKVGSLVTLSACVVGMLIMGDSFLYGALPVSAGTLGLTLWQVSLLLSANRWIRLLSNSLAAVSLSHWPTKPLFVGATLLGLASCISFAASLSFPFLLASRLIWGIAWSLYRQSAYLAVWAHPASTHGRLLGLWWGLVRLGSGISVLFGGWLLDRTRFSFSMGVISAFSGLGFALSFLPSWPSHVEGTGLEAIGMRTSLRKAAHSIWGSSQLKWLVGLVAGSRLILTLLVSITSLYIQIRVGPEVTAIGVGTGTGIILAIHWMSQIVLGPMFGALSDRFGRTRLIVVLSVFLATILGLAGTAHGLTALSLAAIYMLLFSGLRVAIEASNSDGARMTAHPKEVMGYLSTVDDLAAACGPIIGLAWFQEANILFLMWGSGALLLILSVGFAMNQSRMHLNARNI